MAPPPVGIIWDAPPSWVEHLALRSFRQAGHPVTIFAADAAVPIPEGVARGDAAVFDGPPAPPPERLARARLCILAACPDMISVEPDVVCLATLAPVAGTFLARARAGEDVLGTAVLALPADGAVLAAAREAAGRAGGAADLGALLTRLVARHDPGAAILPPETVCPVAFADRQKLLRPPRAVEGLIGPGAAALRLWPATRRDLALRHGGVPPAGSFLAALALRFGIDPDAAPVQRDAAPSATDPVGAVAALLDRLGPRIESLADVGGTAPALAAAAFARFDCDLIAIDIDRSGAFPPEPSAWIVPYRAALAAAGVPERRFRVVRGPGGLKPVDAILNLEGCGDTAKIKHLAPVLDAC
ncbi:MAG: hypothetical protein ACK4OP_13170, partial [Gemmobacter sp.]